TSTVDTEVGPDNTAKGDLSTTKTETSLAGIKQALKDRFTKTPVKGALDTATGKDLVVPATTETAGMNLSDSDYPNISATASEPAGRAWEKSFVGSVNQSLVNWRKLRHRIANAHGNKAEVAKAMEDYAHDNDQAAQALAKVVRPAGSAQG